MYLVIEYMKWRYSLFSIEILSSKDGITSGIGAFHALYMPELVKAGRLYKSIPPLYHLDDKKSEFARDKAEYISLYQDKIIKNYSVTLVKDKNKKPMSTSEFKEFIYNTQEYANELIRISKHFGVSKFLIERVAAYLTMTYGKPDMNEFFEDNKKVVKFMEIVQKKFPEVTLKGRNSLRGVVDGHFQSISINNRFIKKIEDLSEIYLKYGYNLIVVEKKGEPEQMSIGEFLDATNKYTIKILRRFKGLGEASSKQLWDTTLNPDTRILIQLTMEDVEKDLKIFEKLHGQSKQNLEDRKKMMSSYKIKREDLDN